MSNGNYHSMENIAAHSANGQARRENFGMRRAAAPQGPSLENSCHFPAPAPFRVYCNPAAFHRVNGQEYHNLVTAYGSSRPLQRE